MDFIQNTPLVFHLKNDEFDKVLKLSLLLGLFFIGFIPLTIWLIFPSEFLSQINWIDVWQKLLLKPIELAKIIFALLAVPVSIWMQSQHNKNARLMLNDSRMSYTSGLPFLSRWLDWCLDLEDIRSEKIKLRFSGNELGAQPVLMYRLSWGASGLRQVRPAAWVLPNQTTLSVQKPTSFFGFVNWKRTENMTLLQQQFDQLPLINALMQRGVVLPKVSKKRDGIGLDLMAYPRMKVAVISFFTTLVGAFVLFHLMRHQHYFSLQPFSLQLAFGVLAGFLMFIWLWGDKPNAGNTAEQAGFIGTQVLLAGLFAVSAGLCAPSLPLLLASTVLSTEDQAFNVQQSPLLLKTFLPANMPDIQPTQALEYWQSLKDGEVVTLPVSRGFAGLWWQYDSSGLQEKVEVFYGSLPRSVKH